jgi:hypothetical protein
MTPLTATEFATFGPVHLDVVDLTRSLGFWRDLVGLQVLEDHSAETVGLGAGGDVLVVLHAGASGPARPGYAGLYHLAVHLLFTTCRAQRFCRRRGRAYGWSQDPAGCSLQFVAVRIRTRRSTFSGLLQSSQLDWPDFAVVTGASPVDRSVES